MENDNGVDSDNDYTFEADEESDSMQSHEIKAIQRVNSRKNVNFGFPEGEVSLSMLKFKFFCISSIRWCTMSCGCVKLA